MTVQGTTSSTTRAGSIDRSTPAYDAFITALKNTHGMEEEALQIMGRQLDRLENYPEVAAALRKHTEETKQQQRRIESVLDSYGETWSAIKEGLLGIMGNLAAVAHVPATDEILKDQFANHAFENYEIAAYETLITLAKAAGHTDIAPFQESLREEEQMAKTVRDSLEPVTQKYLKLYSSGATASH